MVVSVLWSCTEEEAKYEQAMMLAKHDTNLPDVRHYKYTRCCAHPVALNLKFGLAGSGCRRR